MPTERKTKKPNFVHKKYPDIYLQKIHTLSYLFMRYNPTYFSYFEKWMFFIFPNRFLHEIGFSRHFYMC
jgi:hypothetical protein